MTTKVYIVQKESEFQPGKFYWVDEDRSIKRAKAMVDTYKIYDKEKREYRIIKRTIKDEVVK